MSDSLVFARMPVRNRPTLVSLYLKNQKPAEIRITPTDRISVLGNIYVGRIENRKKNIGAAFVRFQEDRTGFLPLPENSPAKEGDLVLVQVEKEAMKQKLPRLTQNLTLTGRWIVLGTDHPGIYYSKKLSPEDKDRINKMAVKIFGNGDSRQFGIVFRTNAPEASPEELEEEYRSLLSEMDSVLRFGMTRTLYSCLHQADAAWMALFRQYAGSCLRQITTDDPEIWRTLTDQQKPADAGVSVRLYEDPMVELYRLYNLTTLLHELDSKTVHLKSGGFLVIEETEAFVAIDVNTGRDTAKRSRQETIRRTNLEAVREIARQIRLRQLSGTILVDFINDSRPGAGNELTEAMQNAVREDPVPAHVIDMTPLYIMELTRKKRVRSWSEQIRLLTEG
ncbi:MAG: ribonuclease E/G [Lachnospiraceae bacterium]|nr:ribonuclease E/G [Lachnospiraceae bacterium]